MHIISLYNIKGGVGKTAACVNFAYMAAADGFRTLLWDLDPQGAASFYYGAQPTVKSSTKKILEQSVPIQEAIHPTAYTDLDIIPADLSARKLDVMLEATGSVKKQFKNLLKGVADEYDFVFVDCPPGVSHVADNVFFASEVVLMPVIPTTLSIRTYDQVKQYFADKGIEDSKLSCFFSMVDTRKKMHTETIEALLADNRFFGHYIPYLSEIERMGIRNAPVGVYAPNGYAATCYRALWDEIKEGVL